ncbi:MAG: hypothetical protein K6E76_00560 [Patescibacteria group bacterium]|nr:hypothetical protein [Patescibacteria group bacterium]
MDPQTPEEARKLGETLEQILELSRENEELKKTYNISNYEHYLNNTMFLIKQYGKDKFLKQTKKIKEYTETLNAITKGSEFDFDKYQQYIDKRNAINLDNHFNNFSEFQDVLSIREGNKRFPLTL